ncbi:glutaredoxin family protein [Shewanella sp. 202IG2-18]|uniref:glutaredoxin family protein n=1 Tax=Parashewanella hymeniacidonis TaxID=2807618 RepID=UPI0019611FDC|nr:glutaredoxin family protein [Parashewanella hymeniacidonis]MBM7071908.1 glutaredoxin family protein [Parashewanella hymeniacidonis]
MHKPEMELVLFHTDGCHLCEVAEAQLKELSLPFVMKDICDDETLAELYGIRIPVLMNNSNSKELGWPFDVEDISKFLGA